MYGPRYIFRSCHRLSGAKAFSAVFDCGVRKTVGPLQVRGKPNGLVHGRLGLTVSRRVGNSVKRHRIKRLLREAFRLSQHDWPMGYDIVIVVHPHDIAALADYQRMLFAAVRSVHQQWARRAGEKEA
jgi:ribonuclease P protein component